MRITQYIIYFVIDLLLLTDFDSHLIQTYPTFFFFKQRGNGKRHDKTIQKKREKIIKSYRNQDNKESEQREHRQDNTSKKIEQREQKQDNRSNKSKTIEQREQK